jgi:hypothetical protein
MHSKTFGLALILLCTVVGSLGSTERSSADTTPAVAVGPQYDSAHVYVAPEQMDGFAASFLATFGGQSTKRAVSTVTPSPSTTMSQILQTPVGIVSLFGYTTPIPYPFGTERTG